VTSEDLKLCDLVVINCCIVDEDHYPQGMFYLVIKKCERKKNDKLKK
jgi:hypothetical protein